MYILDCVGIYTISYKNKYQYLAKFHENWWKTEEVVRDARFSPHFCHNMPFMATLFLSLSKKHIYTISAKFHENWWKTEEVVRDARFFPHFCHNMPLPWQHSFCHCRKMCLAHLHSKANISAKFHENWSKTEEVVRDLATDRPTGLATDRPTDDTLIPIYPPYTLRVCGGIKKQGIYKKIIWSKFIISYNAIASDLIQVRIIWFSVWIPCLGTLGIKFGNHAVPRLSSMMYTVIVLKYLVEKSTKYTIQRVVIWFLMYILDCVGIYTISYKNKYQYLGHSKVQSSIWYLYDNFSARPKY